MASGLTEKEVEEIAARVLKRFLTSWQFVVIALTLIIISVSIAVAMSYMPD